MFDLIIVGGGPAGATAAVYAARKQLKTVFITNEWGGQSTVSTDIQNWIGTPHISGADLAKNLRAHVEEYAGDTLRIIAPALAEKLEQKGTGITVTLKNGEVLEARSLFVASGAVRRTLDVPGAKEYENKGLTYCASCDGPLFSDQDVVVVGGGNAAFETALQLLAYCKSVTLVNRSNTFRAETITIAAARNNPKMKIITGVMPSKIIGEKFVTGFGYTDVSGVETILPVSGIFVEIGSIPNTQWLGDLVMRTSGGHVLVDSRSQRVTPSLTGHSFPIWAAGDCTDGLYHQNNIAAGDAVKAIEDLYIHLQKSI